jgi:5-methylcytosine-specific restriction endonuclease McrA
MICGYCGRGSRRCECGDDDSDLRRFLARGGGEFAARWRETPYKRGVPPQIKRRERATLRAHYTVWYAALVEHYGARCLNCGANEHLAIDHVIPIAKGGESALENLQLLCAECNRLKGKLVVDCRGRV